MRLQISPRLELRLLRPDEANLVFDEIDANREFLRVWLPWLDENLTAADTRPHIEHWWRGYHQGLGFSLGIFADLEFCGTIGFHAFDTRNRITSLGYWLSERFTGRGIMTQAVGRLTQYAFVERNINRLYIRCATENVPSRRIPERLGFIHEGTQREAEWLYDRFIDLEVYSMLQREWLRRPA